MIKLKKRIRVKQMRFFANSKQNISLLIRHQNRINNVNNAV